MSPILAQNIGFSLLGVGDFNCANKICITPTPVAIVTKNYRILTENLLYFACRRDIVVVAQ